MQLSFVLVSVVFLSFACHAVKRTVISVVLVQKAFYGFTISQKNYHLQSFDIDCDFNKKWVINGSCSITRYPNGTGSLSASTFVLRPADGLFVSFQ
jgi:hypothetical protein